MEIPTILRRAEHSALSAITLSGTVLDLGGDCRAAYRSEFRGEFTITSLNFDAATKPDLFHDLEKPVPFPDASFDHVLLINVLEHIYEYRQLIAEAARLVRPGGTVVVAVPFLFPIHPSPNDFWRFSPEALRRECARAGLSVESLVPLGDGVFSARYVMLDRLMPSPARLVGTVTLRPLASLLDRVFHRLAHRLKKKYDPADYALGHCLVARRGTS